MVKSLNTRVQCRWTSMASVTVMYYRNTSSILACVCVSVLHWIVCAQTLSTTKILQADTFALLTLWNSSAIQISWTCTSTKHWIIINYYTQTSFNRNLCFCLIIRFIYYEYNGFISHRNTLSKNVPHFFNNSVKNDAHPFNGPCPVLPRWTGTRR